MFADEFAPDLDRDAFTVEAILKIQGIMRSDGEVFSLVAPTRHGPIPVGVVVEFRWYGYWWPHADWFPEASPRNRVEAAVSFFAATKAERPKIVACEMQYVPFFDHVCKYGVLRPVGTLRLQGKRLYETT